MENRKIWKTSATPTPTLHHGTCSKSHKFEQQRALGFPSLKIASEKQRASGYREVRERRRVQLLRDIEAANQRKLAEDPTFEPPPPLPDLPDRASANPRLGYQVCPRPGCHARCKIRSTFARCTKEVIVRKSRISANSRVVTIFTSRHRKRIGTSKRFMKHRRLDAPGVTES
jgi:hypothetical protein